MQQKRTRKRTVLVMAGLVLSLTAATFTWDGGGGSTDANFHHAVNWVGNSGYPDGTDDHAVYPYVAGGWQSWLIPEHIGNLLVESSVDFAPEPAAIPAPVTLEVASFTIDAQDDDLEVTMAAGARILVP